MFRLSELSERILRIFSDTGPGFRRGGRQGNVLQVADEKRETSQLECMVILVMDKIG